MTDLKKSGLRKRAMSLVMTLVMCLSMFGMMNFAQADIFTDYVNINGNQVSVAAGNNNAALNMGGVVSKYQSIASVITGLLTVTMFIFMLIQFTKLGAAGDNESARKKAITGIMTTGIATALLGGATIIIGFFWNFLA